ncbi:MAG TPA: translocation/assembly module TamB domain-containing protein, partial [Burkholderiales bacterium]|nr:translocation/assembly module TamB domain-containing protein [Burkholderiales bacterium]
HIALGGAAPASVSADGRFELEHESFPLAATLALGGSLERLELRLGLRQAQTTAEVKATLAPFRPQHIVALDARVAPVDPARLQAGLPHAALALAVSASGSDRGLQGKVEVTNPAAGPIDKQRLPVAALRARVASKDLASAVLEELRVELAGGGVLEGRGELGPGGFRGTVRATGLNLRGLRSTLRETALAGPLELDLAREQQTVRGTLAQAGMTVSAEAVRRGDTVDVRSLRAAAQGGEIAGSGRLRLADPLAFEANLQLARFDPAAFGDYPAGSISGTVQAQGRLAAEPRIDVGWSIADSTLLELPLATKGSARIAGRHVLQADVTASLGNSRASAHGSFGTPPDKLAWTLEAARLDELAADLAGRMQARGTLGGTWSAPEGVIDAELTSLEVRGYEIPGATLNIAGTLARHEARLSVRTAAAEMRARLRGGYDAGVWSGEIASLQGAGAVGFTLRAPTPLKLARSRVELGRLEAVIGNGRLLVRELNWSRERLASSGEFAGLPAQWLVAAAGLSERLRASMLLDGDWSIAAAPSLDGTLRVRRASGDFTIVDERAIDLGVSGATLDARFTDAGVGARLDFTSRYISAAAAGQVGRDAHGGVFGVGPDSSLLVQGQLELSRTRALVQPVLADARFDGRITADLQASGTLGAPVFSGTLRGDALAFEYPPYGVYLKSGELRAKLAGDRLQVERFNVQAGAGNFSATGTLPLRFADGNAKLTWQAKNFGVLERPDLRLVTSGEGEASFDGKRFALSGELRAERGHYEFERERMPKLGEDVVVSGEARASPQARTPLPLDLNVDLDLGSNLSVRVQGLEGKLTGRINLVTSKEGELRAYGKLTAVNAIFYAYGQKLQVDPGMLVFDGPLDNPGLQVTAWRRNQAVEAGVQLSGTMRAPIVQIVSQPQVSEGERLSWLVLGRAPTDANKADLGLLQAAAGALLARGNSMPLDRRIAQSFGLDEVSFRGTGELQDRVLAVGKRVSDKLYLSYEQGLGTVASSLVKMDYSLSRRWSLRAETGTSSGGGLFYRFSWD